MSQQVFNKTFKLLWVQGEQLAATSLNLFEVVYLLLIVLTDDLVGVGVVYGAMSTRPKDLVRNGPVSRERHDLFLMDVEFKKPDAANFTVHIKLGIGTVTQVFKESKVPPAFGPD
jgi:hypothetical protein